MRQITKEEKNFLEHHNIDVCKVLDATGMRTGEYKALMSEKEYAVAIGVSPCGAEGHTMRGANGHCVMCKPANLNFRKRFRQEGYVYVAATPARRDIVKIGYTNNVKDRQKSLNTDKYAGYTGWKIHASRLVNEKGVIEHAAHDALKKFAFSTSYFKEGKAQTASELFKYSLKDAISLLDTIVSNNMPKKSQRPLENRDSPADKKKKGDQTTPSTHNYSVKSSTQSSKPKSPREGRRKVKSELWKKPQPAAETSVETKIKDIPPLIARPLDIKKDVVAPQSPPPVNRNQNVFSTQPIEAVNAEEPTHPLIELFKLLLCVVAQT